MPRPLAASRLRIRAATDGDGDEIAGLIAATFAEYAGCVFDRAAEFPELDAVASHFRALGGAVWVARGGGRMLGCIAVVPGGASGTVELHRLYLARAHRGRGVAARLLARALAWAEAKGARSVELWTDTRFVEGQRFYARHGFVATGALRRLDDLSRSHERHYRLELPAARPRTRRPRVRTAAGSAPR